MRWYQMLFWRIFGAVWLVSMLGIGLGLVTYLAVADPQERREAQVERVEIFAKRIIRAYERQGSAPSLRDRHLPLWILDASGKQIFGVNHKPPRQSDVLPVRSDSGSNYRVIFSPSRDAMLLDRFLGFFLSIQAIWVLAVSLLSSLFLAWMIVRPINALRRHLRSLYRDQNLSYRADGPLSRRSDELGGLAREFNQMADYVEKTLVSRETLLRDVSHELRAPLARLRAASGLAEQRWGEDQKILQRISIECNQLDRLISELLALSREENAESTEKTDIKELMLELIEDACLLSPEHQFKFNTDVSAGLARITREPIARIVSNLLGNAICHTPKGTEVSIYLNLENNDLRLRVVDNGPGVSEQLLEEIGLPFKRAATSKGYGLGLSICKKAVERANGSLTFSNAHSGGFEAKLRLPLV